MDNLSKGKSEFENKKNDRKRIKICMKHGIKIEIISPKYHKSMRGIGNSLLHMH